MQYFDNAISLFPFLLMILISIGGFCFTYHLRKQNELVHEIEYQNQQSKQVKYVDEQSQPYGYEPEYQFY